MKIKKTIKILVGASSFLLAPLTRVLAQIDDTLTKTAASASKINVDATIPGTVGAIIQLALSFVGTIFFVFIVYSGIQWMTAGGEEDKVDKATTRIKNATIGLAITGAAYFLTWFISRAVTGGV